jgi:hypothetical protein
MGSPTKQKWITKLLDYDFIIEYQKFEKVQANSPNDGTLLLITFPNST